MCGIAGFSLSTDSQVQRTLAAQALLAGIAERGADAVGYAHRSPDGEVEITKLRGGASALLDELSLPPSACAALIHVRDFTKGHPEIEGNNHPVRHGAVVGIHNGIVENDDALLARYRIARAEPQMTVDSEAIFALMEIRRHDPRALAELRGAMAAAWLDARDGETLFLARGRLRHSGSAARPTGSTSPPRDVLWRSPPPLCGPRSTSPRCARGASSTSSRDASCASAAFVRIAAIARRARSRRSVRRARQSRASSAWQRSRRSHPRQASSVPSGNTATSSSRRRSRTRNWNAVHAPRGTSRSR